MEDKLKENWHALLFGVRRSIRYHTYRRKFFDRLSVMADFLIIVSGGTVVGFASAGGENTHQAWTIAFGAFIAIVGAFDLVIGFSNKSRDHHDLAREFSQLERDMAACGENRTTEHLVKFQNRRLEIEEDEPAIMRVLDCYCHNDLVRAMGLSADHKVRITFWQSVFKEWADFHPSTLKKEFELRPKAAGNDLKPQTEAAA